VIAAFALLLVRPNPVHVRRLPLLIAAKALKPSKAFLGVAFARDDPFAAGINVRWGIFVVIRGFFVIRVNVAAMLFQSAAGFKSFGANIASRHCNYVILYSQI